MKFTTYGPYEIPLLGHRQISRRRKDLAPFWNAALKDSEKLPIAIGCFVFAVRSSGGAWPKPWYVGMTQSSFYVEAFSERNRSIYNEVLSELAQTAENKRTPLLFLISAQTAKGKFVRPPRGKNKRPAIGRLEELLIGLAARRNHELKNVHGKVNPDHVDLTGVTRYKEGGGAYTKPTTRLRGVLDIG